MVKPSNAQISLILNQENPESVLTEVKRIFTYYYGRNYLKIVKNTFHLIKNLFSGKFPGYQACNTEYHDLCHTMDAFIAAVRLIDGKNIFEKPFPVKIAVDLLLASLFHDTGYIQENGDKTGTGAKYTRIHVGRSIQFLQKNRVLFGINMDDAGLISKIISCTGLNAECDNMCFQNEEEIKAGAILGTADLIGQMADRNYLEKLLFLYYEFKEASISGYNTQFDILKNTLSFYDQTKKRLDGSFKKAYTYAFYHFKERYQIPRNLYMDSIEKHIGYLKEIIMDESTNFRHKLKRMDLKEKELKYLEKSIDQPLEMNFANSSIIS